MSEHRHLDEDIARCTGCHDYCTQTDFCKCCLRAEIDALRAQVQAVRELCEPRPRPGHNPNVEWYPQVTAEQVLRALDGDGDA